MNEAGRKAPLETGGVLLGWSDPTDHEFVVCEMVGPGPRARHRHTRFVPDARWQRERIAELYASSGRTLRYLGDWHSHPGGGEQPSRRDERTARRIARARAARALRPLMLILADSGTTWRPATYQLARGELIAVECTITDF